jgi:integrase
MHEPDVFEPMVETGLRCGEMYRSKRTDAFPDDRYPKVTKCETKNPVRRVPLSEKAKNILAARIKRFDPEFLFPQNDIDGREPAMDLTAEHSRARL